MDNLLSGILIVVICAAGYFYSWKLKSRDKFGAAVLMLMLCGLLLRAFVSADFFLHSWDERYHALVAKHLMQHWLKPTLYENPVLPYDYTNWSKNHVWLHKQPFPLWAMALSMKLFGVNEIALRIPSILLSIAGICLTFSIATYFFNKNVGYLSAFLFSINGFIIELTAGRSSTDHVDIFFLFFIELSICLSILFAQRQKTIYNILAGVALGAAILTKWLPALIVLPVWMLLVLNEGNFKPQRMFLQFILLIAIATLIFLPWQLYIFKVFPTEASWEASYNLKHFTEVVEAKAGSVFFFIGTMGENYGELIYIPLIWFVWKVFKNLNDYKNLAVMTWMLIPLLFFSLAKTKMQGYILFTSPTLFMITATFWCMLAGYKKDHSPKWLFNLILFLLVALPIRYCIERTRVFEHRDRNPEWVTSLKKLNDKKINNGILLNYDRPVEAMFYTDLTAYATLPDQKIITDLMKQGHTVIINDDGKIPLEVESMQGVLIEKLAP